MTKLSAGLAPIVLRSDNFTAPARTPWGGRRIVSHYKAQLGLPGAFANAPVGESWELSLGPELPSQTDDGRSLLELVAQDPLAYLGDEAASGASALLVKWLDADDHLSVQIHPAVDDPKLAPDETGKPECWYIVERAAGAGLYLGLAPGVTDASMRAALESGGDVSKLLQFVPVEPGDFYLLQPGMPHAVGRGVTLIEPQYVAPGRRGLTLRYWDWNRRYDEHGKQAESGRPRELHVERALEVTDWQNTSDPRWLAAQRWHDPDRLRGQAGVAALSGEVEPARCQLLCAEAAAPVHSDYLRAARIWGDGALELPHWNTLRALTVIDGELELAGAFGGVRATRGRTLALPAGLRDLRCRLSRCQALLSGVVPA
jgi:mannose-6-phosphate isomerase class I